VLGGLMCFPKISILENVLHGLSFFAAKIKKPHHDFFSVICVCCLLVGKWLSNCTSTFDWTALLGWACFSLVDESVRIAVFSDNF